MNSDLESFPFRSFSIRTGLLIVDHHPPPLRVSDLFRPEPHQLDPRSGDESRADRIRGPEPRANQKKTDHTMINNDNSSIVNDEL